MRQAINWPVANFAAAGGVSLIIVVLCAGVVQAQGNVLMGLDGNFVNNIGANYGTFNYGNTVGQAGG